MIPQEILHTNQTNNHEKTIISSTLLNIDSSFRNIKPKHIYNSNNFYLSPDPIEFIQNSNIITINYPNHDFVIGDNIIIQNVTGIIKILHNALYLVNNLKYVILNIENNEISINYTNYIDKLYTRIELVGKQNTPYFINNITFNSLIGIKVVFLANDILINDNVKKLAYDLYNSFDEKTLNTKFLFIELDIPYVDLNNNNYLRCNYRDIILCILQGFNLHHYKYSPRIPILLRKTYHLPIHFLLNYPCYSYYSRFQYHCHCHLRQTHLLNNLFLFSFQPECFLARLLRSHLLVLYRQGFQIPQTNLRKISPRIQ